MSQCSWFQSTSPMSSIQCQEARDHFLPVQSALKAPTLSLAVLATQAVTASHKDAGTRPVGSHRWNLSPGSCAALGHNGYPAKTQQRPWDIWTLGFGSPAHSRLWESVCEAKAQEDREHKTACAVELTGGETYWVPASCTRRTHGRARGPLARTTGVTGRSHVLLTLWVLKARGMADPEHGRQ